MCGCNKNKQREFVVIKADGSKVNVRTRQEALSLVRKEGGTWREVPK